LGIGDELSMLIATATVLHRVFTFDKSLHTTVVSGVISAIAMALFITWHCIEDELIMHSVLFGMSNSWGYILFFRCGRGLGASFEGGLLM